MLVMFSAMDITGRDQQPKLNASAHNAIFFFVFIFMSSFIMLQLFAGVIVDNLSRSRGATL